MAKFLHRHKLPKLTKKETENLNSCIFVQELELVTKLQTTFAGDVFAGEFYQTFKKIP